MPTDNPKISLYVPQQIYDRFKDFKQERNLSMSQAGIVILAEYFGIEETIKKITERTTVGGVTLAEFEKLQVEVLELKKQVDQIKSTSRPKVLVSTDKNLYLDKTKNLDIDNRQEKIKKNKSQFELLPDLKSNSISLPTKLLAKRLEVKVKTLSTTKSKKGTDYFHEWSKTKDPDQIGWIPESRTTFTIRDQLSSRKLSILQNWINENQ